MTPARRGLTVGLVLTVTLVAFEALAVITVLPAIKDDLRGIGLYGWVTSAFQLGLLVGIVVAGGQADRRGPAPPFVVGVLVFALGLSAGGLAPSMLVLVLARGLQGLGAGAVPAVAYAAIGRSYPEALRPRVFAVMSTAWVVPGLIGPAISALVAERFGWRWVFLGLLPLVLASAALAWAPLRRLGPPEEPLGQRGRLAKALGVTVGCGLLLAGLTSRSALVGAVLVAAGLAVGLVPLRGLLPPGTLSARPGLPVAVLSRGLLTFAFFGADTYVPLAVTSARGQSTAVASMAVTAATLAWTAGSWVQERRAADWPGRRLIRAGFLILAAGIALEVAALFPGVPVAVGVVGWAVGGFGIGLAYSPVSLIVLGAAPSGQEGSASAALQLTETLGVALGAGLGGVLVATGAAAGWLPRTGLAGAFALTAAVALLAAVLARRIPSRTIPAPDRPGGRP
jgi:MFS family permease